MGSAVCPPAPQDMNLLRRAYRSPVQGVVTSLVRVAEHSFSGKGLRPEEIAQLVFVFDAAIADLR